MKELIAKVNGILEKYSNMDGITGRNFNIFKICEIHDKEVLICRFIYQLINPKGLHNQGDTFLRKFIVDALGGQIIDNNDKNDEESNLIMTDREIKSAEVFKEYLIQNERRIDLLIKTDKRVIPIEVKIYAGDQEDQCKDYADWAKKQKKDKEYILYYLTLDGHYPSERSVDYEKNQYDNEEEIDKELKEKYKLTRISFKNDILKWIEDCIKDIRIIDKKQIVDNMMQFLNIIKELCNMGTDEQNEEVKNVLNNKESFKAYIAMKQCQAYVTSEIFKNIIESLIKWANNNHYVLDDAYNDYIDQINLLCKGNPIGEKVPGFGIVLNENDTKFNCKLSICVEATKNDGFYFGIYVKDENKNRADAIKQIKMYLNEKCINGYSNTYWPFWRYINDINFANPKDSFAELLDENYLKNFIEDIEAEFEKLYSVLIDSK